jgi:hypothetical protein
MNKYAYFGINKKVNQENLIKVFFFKKSDLLDN